MDINISSQIVVQTAAQWAADTTVYSDKRILVTSDVYYGSTDQRKFKIADGVQTWTQLDYMPLSQTLSQVLANGNKTNEVSIVSNNGYSTSETSNSQIYLRWFNSNYNNQLGLTDAATYLSYYNIITNKLALLSFDDTKAILQHTTKIDLDAPTINLPQGTASKLLKLDASKNVTYVDEGLSLSGGNANQDIDVGNYSINAKSFHVKGTGGAGHLGLKHQSGNITASTSESTLGANSSGDPVWKNDGNAIQEILLKDSVNTATNYTTPLDADKVSIWDTANSLLKAVTWSNIKATLKTYFDTLYKATFTENTAFNKNFGTGTTNIVEIGSTLGNSLITSTDANGKLQTLATSTYPTLTELSYVKGLSSAVQTQLNSLNGSTQYAVASGTDTYTASLSPVPAAYVTGMQVRIKIPNTNTVTNPTLNLNSLGAKTIKGVNGVAIPIGQFYVNGDYLFIYDGTDFILQSGIMDRKDISYFRKTGTTTYERWYSTNFTNAALTTFPSLTKDVIRAVPFIVSKTTTLDRIGMEVTAGGTASSVIRLGIYDDVNGVPTNLITDSGTIAADSATQQSITINQTLTPGLYYLTFVHNSTASITVRGHFAYTHPQICGFNASWNSTQNAGMIAATYTYSTLPSTFPTTAISPVTGSVVPGVFVRLSA